MARDRAQTCTAGKLALDIGNKLQGRGARRCTWGSFAEQDGIHIQKPPWLLISRPAHHDAVDTIKMSAGLLNICDAAIEHNNKPRMLRFEAIDPVVIERRNVAIRARRETGEPSLAGVNDKGGNARPHDMRGERLERFLGILVVDANSAFDRNRHLHLGPHRRDALGDETGLRHQAGTEAAFLYPVRRTSDIKIDLVVTKIGGDLGALREVSRIGTAELNCDGILGGVEGQQACAVPMQHGSCGNHLRIDPGAAREQAMEEPAMAVGPFHHGRDAEAVVLLLR